MLKKFLFHGYYIAKYKNTDVIAEGNSTTVLTLSDPSQWWLCFDQMRSDLTSQIAKQPGYHGLESNIDIIFMHTSILEWRE